MRRLSLIMWLLGSLILVAQVGCSSPKGDVSGEVSYEGELIQSGQISFTPANGKGPDAAGEITNGRYEVKGLTPGEKIVKVIAVKKVNFASQSSEMAAKAAEARKTGNHDGLVDPADIIPENAEGNNTKVEIKAGANSHNFKLSKPKGKS